MIFNKTVLNGLSNFIPHEVIVCDDKDPPWFNGKVKSLFNEKLGTYNVYRKNSNNIQLRNNLRSLQQCLRDLIDDSKQKYFLRLSQKLTTIQKNTKAYWALLKIFLNSRKMPDIPSLFNNNKFITDFNPIQDGLLRRCSRMGGSFLAPPP